MDGPKFSCLAVLFNDPFDIPLGHNTGYPVHKLSILEEKEGGNGHDLELSGYIQVLIGVQLSKGHIRVLLG